MTFKPDKNTTHFGYREVLMGEKESLVKESVFRSVAPKYDLMNDLMSFGLKRVWKRFTLSPDRSSQRAMCVGCRIWHGRSR